jgi:hypothetical protein
MSLPPGVLARSLAMTFPQFTLCDAGLNNTLLSYLNPLTNEQVTQFVQWLQNHPDSAAAGDVLNPPGTPQSIPAPLAKPIVDALLPLLISTSSWIIGQAEFAGVAWTSQAGLTPGPEAPQPANGAWRLTSETPRGGLKFSEIAYSGPATPSFRLSLINDQPRHLSVYVMFSKAGVPVVPANWTSRLPPGVPSSFETDMVKYVDVLAPNVAVAGIAVGGSAQEIAFALPENADTARLLFGGLGTSAFSAIPDAAGIILTFVLDVFVPWVVQGSGQSGDNLAQWFGGLLSDRKIIGDVIAGGAFLTQGVSGNDAMFAALANSLTGVVLGDKLSRLRSVIAKQLGSPPGESYSWVDQFAPAAGWSAQLVQSFLAAGLNPQYWPARTPATMALDLSPSTTLELDLTVLPDPVSGVWPYKAIGYQASIFYAEGFSQTLTGTVPTPQSNAPLTVGFGSVRNGGAIEIAVELRDGVGTIVAQGKARISPVLSGRSRTVATQISVTDMPVAVGSTTQYRHVARLTCQNGVYAWDPKAAKPVAVGLDRTSTQTPALTSLNGLTLQGDQLCLGYAWGGSNQNIPACGGGAPLQNAYFIQNIGTAAPAAQLKSIPCGLVAAPMLAYAAEAKAADGPGHGGYYLDTQGTDIYLRPVAFEPGSFDLQATISFARFPAQSGLTDICLHPAGYAAAVSLDRNVLQIVPLALAALADAQAPMALSYGGAGSRIGLFNNPIAVAVTPGGGFVMLEQGNARVQAFDVNGNPLPLFKGQPFFALRSAPQPAYLDIAVSAAGLIHVLGSQNGGTAVNDFFLDIYDADGRPLNQTFGVNAARIAIGAGQTLYTLNFDSLTGPGGRTEPTISAWRPDP